MLCCCKEAESSVSLTLKMMQNQESRTTDLSRVAIPERVLTPTHNLVCEWELIKFSGSNNKATPISGKISSMVNNYIFL